MKGKFKEKILNLRNIIVSLIIVVIAAASGISIVQNKTQNVETNLDEAEKYVNFDGNDIVNAAISLANGEKFVIGKDSKGNDILFNRNKVSNGCFGLAENTLKKLGSTKENLNIIGTLTGFQNGTSCFNIIENNGYSLEPGDILWRKWSCNDILRKI